MMMRRRMMRMVKTQKRLNTNETTDSASNINHNRLDDIEDKNDENNIPPRKNYDKKREFVIPKLIDNKRRHYEKNLSSAQLDKLLLEESQFCKGLTATMRENQQ